MMMMSNRTKATAYFVGWFLGLVLTVAIWGACRDNANAAPRVMVDKEKVKQLRGPGPAARRWSRHERYILKAIWKHEVTEHSSTETFAEYVANLPAYGQGAP